MQDQTQFEPGDFQIIQHLAPFVIGDGFNYLGIYDDGSKCNEVWNVFSYLDPLVEHVLMGLLEEGNAGNAELEHERVLVGFSFRPCPGSLSTSMAHPTIRQTSSLKSKVSLASICVYSRLIFFSSSFQRVLKDFSARGGKSRVSVQPGTFVGCDCRPESFRAQRTAREPSRYSELSVMPAK